MTSHTKEPTKDERPTQEEPENSGVDQRVNDKAEPQRPHGENFVTERDRGDHHVTAMQRHRASQRMERPAVFDVGWGVTNFHFAGAVMVSDCYGLSRGEN